MKTSFRSLTPILTPVFHVPEGARLEAPINGSGYEATELTIREEQAPSTQLSAKHSCLLLQVLDGVLLAAIHPSGEDQY